MSIAIDDTELTGQQRSVISSSLLINPSTDGYRKKKSFPFYTVRDNKWYLPYTFASNFIAYSLSKSDKSQPSTQSPSTQSSSTQSSSTQSPSTQGQVTQHSQLSHKSWPATNFNFLGQLRTEQVNHARTCLERLRLDNTFTLCLYTAAGKTVIGAYVASQSSLITAVLYTSIPLGRQWYKTFTQFTDASVCLVGSNVKDPLPTVQVYICPLTRVKHVASEIRSRVGFLIIDEAHLICTPGNVDNILEWQPQKILAETATPDRDDKQSIMLKHLCGPNRLEIPFPRPYTVVHINTRRRYVTPCKGRKKDWVQLVSDITSDEERDKILLDIAKQHPSDNDKVIVFTNRVEHVNRLTNMLIQVGYSADSMAGDKGSYKNSKFLVGTIPKIGTGFDEQAYCDDFDGIPSRIVVLMISIKNLARLYQTIGRGFRAPDPIVYELLDDNEIIMRHWLKRQGWFRRSGAIIKSAQDVGLTITTTPSPPKETLPSSVPAQGLRDPPEVPRKRKSGGSGATQGNNRGGRGRIAPKFGREEAPAYLQALLESAKLNYSHFYDPRRERIIPDTYVTADVSRIHLSLDQ